MGMESGRWVGHERVMGMVEMGMVEMGMGLRMAGMRLAVVGF